jgi:hypothetical protein
MRLSTPELWFFLASNGMITTVESGPVSSDCILIEIAVLVISIARKGPASATIGMTLSVVDSSKYAAALSILAQLVSTIVYKYWFESESKSGCINAANRCH